MQACARESPEISTSIAVHGGVRQLLELMKSAVQQVSCLQNIVSIVSSLCNDCFDS